jgi:serralysin
MTIVIDTFSEPLQGVSAIGEGLGSNINSYVAQTFRAAGPALESVSFGLKTWTGNGTHFKLLIVTATGSPTVPDPTFDPGTVLFESELIFQPGATEYEVFTVDTGDLPLTPGGYYAFVLDARAGFDGNSSFSTVRGGKVYDEGGTAKLDEPTANRASDLNAEWNASTVDLGFRLVFGEAAVPKFIDGTTDKDDLDGGPGPETLRGFAGNDTLSGGDGADILIGGTGKDKQTGGPGEDVFQFASIKEIGKGKKADTITDFEQGPDLIDLSAIDANGSKRGEGRFKFLKKDGANFKEKAGELMFEQIDKKSTGKDLTMVRGDTNGDGKPDFELRVTGLTKFTADDFVL